MHIEPIGCSIDCDTYRGTNDSSLNDEEEEDECQLLINNNKQLQQQKAIKGANQNTKNKSLRDMSSCNYNQHQHSVNKSTHLFGKLLAYLVNSLQQSAADMPTSSSDGEFTFRSDWPPNAKNGVYNFIKNDNRSREKSLYEITRSNSPLSRRFATTTRNDKMLTKNSKRPLTPRLASQMLFLFILLVLLILAIMLLVKLLTLIQEHKQANDGSLLMAKIDRELNEAHRRQYELEQSARWLVASSKCHIPVLDPWHQSIVKYVRVEEPMNCSDIISESIEEDNNNNYITTTIKTLTFVRSNRLYFTREAIRNGALSGQCCFRKIDRSQENDDDLEYHDDCILLQEDGIEIDVPLIEIKCDSEALNNYTNVHTFVVHDEEEESALKRVATDKLNNDDYYNIIMLGVDTVSRLNGIRQLSKTLKLLNSLYHTLEFVGYNKVGENTFPNLIPLLTGLKPEQLTQIQCWLATNYTQNSERGDDYLDNCKYLWNFYQQVGYMTYFSEDWPSASTFNYLKPGFKHEPTAYYGRPFTLARKQLLFPRIKSIGCESCQLDKPIVQIDLDNLKSFIQGHNDIPYFAFHWINCPQHDDLNGASKVDHILEQFFEDMHNITQNDRTFVIFFSDHGYRWNDFVSTRIGHYESSLPMLTIAPPTRFIQQHPDLYENLKQHQKVLLTPFDMFKTLVDIRNLGLKSASNASLSPKSVRQAPNPSAKSLAYPTSKANPGVLTTTPYPTASTTIRQLKIPDGLSYRQDFTTISLLDKHNASELDRSCIDAGIPDSYCICHQFENVTTDTNDVLGAAYYLVYVYLGARLKSHSQICHLLDLKDIHKAELYDLETMKATKSKTAKRRRRRKAVTIIPDYESSPSQTTTTAVPGESVSEDIDRHNYLPNREYNILFSTKPGGGLFQEVVRYYGDNLDKCKMEVAKAKKIIDDKWADFNDKHASVMQMNTVCEFSVHSESISRLNLYKDQSKCVKSNIELKKVCYCKS